MKDDWRAALAAATPETFEFVGGPKDGDRELLAGGDLLWGENGGVYRRIYNVGGWSGKPVHYGLASTLPTAHMSEMRWESHGSY